MVLSSVELSITKIFNRNTVKIRYSGANNMYKIFNNHNRRLLDELNKNNERMV